MKRQGFSLTEVIMIIFTLAVIAAALFPLKIIDINQAERIAKWKGYYSELSYGFDLMKQSKQAFIQDYKDNLSLNSEKFFDIFSQFLGVDVDKTLKTDFLKYKKMYLNGKRISNNSKYNTHRFLHLKNGIILSFSGFERQNPNQPLGIIFVDVDGSLKRNFIGRDIFAVLVFADKLEPFGYNSTRQQMKEDCSPVGSGLQCSAYYLADGAF